MLFGVGMRRRVVCFPKRGAPQIMVMWSGKFCVQERALHTSRIDKPGLFLVSVKAIGRPGSSKYGFFNVVAMDVLAMSSMKPAKEVQYLVRSARTCSTLTAHATRTSSNNVEDGVSRRCMKTYLRGTRRELMTGMETTVIFGSADESRAFSDFSDTWCHKVFCCAIQCLCCYLLGAGGLVHG